MPRNTRVHKLIADFADVRREEFSVTRKEALVSLVDDQVKIVDLDRVTVPMLPEQPNGFQGKPAGFEIPHERTAENFFVPARVHAVLDLVSEGFCLAGRKPFADFQY
jgi:hypothetical protein